MKPTLPTEGEVLDSGMFATADPDLLNSFMNVGSLASCFRRLVLYSYMTDSSPTRVISNMTVNQRMSRIS